MPSLVYSLWIGVTIVDEWHETDPLWEDVTVKKKHKSVVVKT